MDPLGASASLVTLIDLVVKTIKAVNRTIQSYREAPLELTQLKLQIEGLKSQVVLFRYLQEAVACDELQLKNIEVSLTLDHFLRQSVFLLSSVCDHFEKCSLARRDTPRGRLTWALRDTSKIKVWENSVRKQSTELTNLLLLINLRHSSLLHNEFQGLQKQFNPWTVNDNLKLKKCETVASLWNTSAASLENFLPIMTFFQALVTSSEFNQQRVYRIYLRLYVSFFLKVICFNIKIRQASLFNFTVDSLGSAVKIRNLVPDGSPIMEACKAGNTTAVWDLFHSRKASVYDVTPGNLTPLRYAIESGAFELVLFLINNGADVHEYYGPFQKNLLQCAFHFRQLDISRLLIAKGIQVHQTNIHGWSSAFSVYNTHSQSEIKSSTEYLQILSSSAFTEFDIQDGEGWTCMHRAAAFGNAEDIQALLKLGGTPTLQTKNLAWMPIFCAVQFGNISTFSELSKEHPGFLHMRDIRQWTFLHIAVNARRLEMMKLLISLGSDPHARTMATKHFVPDDLKCLAVMPTQIARIRGDAVFDSYVKSLKKAGHSVDLVQSTEGELPDVFWEVEELE